MTFSDISLVAPASGVTHSIVFTGDMIKGNALGFMYIVMIMLGGSVNVVVTPGQPKKLVFITKPNNVTDGGSSLDGCINLFFL